MAGQRRAPIRAGHHRCRNDESRVNCRDFRPRAPQRNLRERARAVSRRSVRAGSAVGSRGPRPRLGRGPLGRSRGRRSKLAGSPGTGFELSVGFDGGSGCGGQALTGIDAGVRSLEEGPACGCVLRGPLGPWLPGVRGAGAIVGFADLQDGLGAEAAPQSDSPRARPTVPPGGMGPSGAVKGRPASRGVWQQRVPSRDAIRGCGRSRDFVVACRLSDDKYECRRKGDCHGAIDCSGAGRGA